jgi:hypothetical protein
MVHVFKPGKHVKKLYSYHKVSINPWFQTMIFHEVIVSNHIYKLFQNNYTFQQFIVSNHESEAQVMVSTP